MILIWIIILSRFFSIIYFLVWANQLFCNELVLLNTWFEWFNRQKKKRKCKLKISETFPYLCIDQCCFMLKLLYFQFGYMSSAWIFPLAISHEELKRSSLYFFNYLNQVSLYPLSVIYNDSYILFLVSFPHRPPSNKDLLNLTFILLHIEKTHSFLSMFFMIPPLINV